MGEPGTEAGTLSVCDMGSGKEVAGGTERSVMCEDQNAMAWSQAKSLPRDKRRPARKGAAQKSLDEAWKLTTY